MAWPAERGALGITPGAPPASIPIGKSTVTGNPSGRGEFTSAWRGLYRVFHPVEYRFYRGSTPPEPGDTPFATNATLPHTPADTYSDGTWYLSMSYFNGVIDSGFLPIGPNGETWRRIEITSGAATGTPPADVTTIQLTRRPNGVIRVFAVYSEAGDNRADQWALAYTTNGSTPATDTPTVTAALTGQGLAVWQYDLPAQSDGTTIKVRVQARRNDGTDAVPVWVYSENSTVETVTADAVGPDAPATVQDWPGRAPGETT